MLTHVTVASVVAGRAHTRAVHAHAAQAVASRVALQHCGGRRSAWRRLNRTVAIRPALVAAHARASERVEATVSAAQAVHRRRSAFVASRPSEAAKAHALTATAHASIGARRLRRATLSFARRTFETFVALTFFCHKHKS